MPRVKHDAKELLQNPHDLDPGCFIECIVCGGDPTVHELSYLAERIWMQTTATRPVLSWNELPMNGLERLKPSITAKPALGGRS